MVWWGTGTPAEDGVRDLCCYCTIADVKDRLGEQWTSGAVYDLVLQDAIEEASRMIDEHKGWRPCHFAAGDQALVTRYYNGTSRCELQINRFLHDAAFAVAVDDDADGVYTAWVEGTDYLVWPYDEEYVTKLVLVTGADVRFTLGQRTVEVTGRLGGYVEPPAQIRKACVIIVAKAFKRGMQMYQDTGAIEELGQLTYTLGIDKEVQAILDAVPGRGWYG